ncbi:hypothetical protein BJV78DRAFT_213928 [Lactifluus subvellereus]|nr:hypothetical protein BJV78DRAFT_213928 [Lactifluus subvellereus]
MHVATANNLGCTLRSGANNLRVLWGRRCGESYHITEHRTTVFWDRDVGNGECHRGQWTMWPNMRRRCSLIVDVDESTATRVEAPNDHDGGLGSSRTHVPSIGQTRSSTRSHISPKNSKIRSTQRPGVCDSLGRKVFVIWNLLGRHCSRPTSRFYLEEYRRRVESACQHPTKPLPSPGRSSSVVRRADNNIPRHPYHQSIFDITEARFRLHGLLSCDA